MNAFGSGGGGFSNPNNDFLVANPPNDSISQIAFSPRTLQPKNFLVGGTWDNEARLWEINPDGSSNMLTSTRHDGPILSVAWREDGQAVFTAGADRIVKMWDLGKNTAATVAQHEEPVRCVEYVSEQAMNTPCIVTGSWDKSVRYWDVRAPSGQPMGVVPAPERVYAMASRGQMLVVGTAERKLIVYDMRKPTTPFLEKDSQLKHQTRCIATFPDSTGFAVGSVEGRVSIDYVLEADIKAEKYFAFKCHRDTKNSNVYAVNSIAFHEEYSTFATAGSDGGFCFWDKDSKSRLKEFNKVDQPITSCCFNYDGKIFAYAVSYDWSKGAFEHNPATKKPYILLHAVQDQEIKSRERSSRQGTRR
mmetsp:Transcript_21556/g.87976  ORF Transcript_21556/g.87976 Transcript_21556/m.87976 type:complete len:361 (-) Transcript_21556:2028-3110(-)